MSTVFIADVLVHPGPGKGEQHKVHEIITPADLGEVAPDDGKKATKAIENILKGRHHSLLAWRVHRVTTSERVVIKRKPARVAKKIEETTDEIIRDFSPREAIKWRNHDHQNYPVKVA